MRIQRPATTTHQDADVAQGAGLQSPDSDLWTIDSVMGPDVTDRETIINLAKMTSNAYVVDPSQSDWWNITQGYNQSHNFGFEDDGLRGQVFVDPTNSTVIISYKGTSVDPRDKTRDKDKLNDNLFFSCCCAEQRPDPYWYGPVCDCRTGVYECSSTCLCHELLREDRYFVAAKKVYAEIRKMYLNANIWLIGHSLGGALASLIGLQYNLPAVSFESPPQRLPAERLGLRISPDPRLTGGFHFGNTGDPVYTGACNGYFSSCSAAGYAFESQCFVGYMCIYDTVVDKGWRISIANHRINNVICGVLEAYETVAACTLDEECVDCNNWYFGKRPKELNTRRS